MANSNDTASRAGQAQGTQGAESSGPAACGAEDLKGLLHHIVERIADTDRRHTTTLEQMQARLAALGEEARQVRPRVPSEFMPAFDRVEEGLDMLADRIQQATHQHAQHRRPAETQAAADMAQQPTAVPQAAAAAPTAEQMAERAAIDVATRAAAQVAYEAEQLIAAASAAAAPAAERMPLRSAVPAGTAHSPSFAAQFDPFDVVDRDNPETSEAWDLASAEALARVYETSDAGFVRRMPDPDAAPLPAPAAATPAAAPQGLAVERDWLEGRFADIAHRVEQSLAEARPDSSLLTLGHRFDQFEQRFGNVLGDVATRADVEGLRLVEAHINELAAHFEHAQAQLSRLDGIEDQLHAVVARLSDRRFADLIENAGAPPAGIETLVADAAERAMQRFAGSQPQAPNLDKLAQLAAEQAISRLSSTLQQTAPSQAGPADEERVGELRQMIEGFITERRQGEEHTATMLDTMQQAMIRVLDRIDAMELAHLQAQSQPSAPQEYVREQVRFNVPSADMGHARAAVDDARNAAEAAVAAAQQAPRQSGHDLPSGPVRMVGEPNQQGRVEPSLGGPRVLDEQTKDDFVAAARRARHKVQSERAQDLPAVSPKPARPAGPDKAQRAAAGPGAGLGKTPKPVGDKVKDAGASFFGLPRKAFLGGAVAVLAIAIAVALGPMRHNTAGKAVIGSASPAQITGTSQANEPAVDVPPATNGSAAGTNDANLTSAEARQATPAAKDGSPKPMIEFEPKRFDDLKIDETAPVRPMSATADTVEEAAPQSAAAGNGIANSEPAIGGITLQHDGAIPTPQDLAHLEQQRRVASLSTELGAAAVSPAALVVEQQISGAEQSKSAGQGSAASNGRSALDLPPATVGPLSLRLAAARGDASAEFEVGARLAEGKGTNQNFAEAVKWYSRSAQRGFAQAQYRLGTLYERGLGVKNDLSRARVWYKRAAEQGNVKSMHNLAVLSAGRQAGSPDYATAAQWFSEAADRGLADSQFNLAVLYQSGLGVPKDMAQAYKWMTLAARSGDRETVRRREALRSQLGAGELEKAQGMLQGWESKPTDLMANDARAAGEAWKQQQATDSKG